MRLLFTIALLFGGVSVWAQYYMDVSTKDGERILIPVADVNEVQIINESDYHKPNGEHNGYEYVDLGLTSGTKWATWNYGATAVGKIGSYVTGGDDQASKSKRPTQAQAQELIDECDWLLRSDVYIVKSKINNNVLILPLSGYQSQEVVSGSLRWVTKGEGRVGYYWTKDSFSSQGFTYFYALRFDFSVRKLSSDYSYKYNVRYVKK